jgi:hypothetical protein
LTASKVTSFNEVAAHSLPLYSDHLEYEALASETNTADELRYHGHVFRAARSNNFRSKLSRRRITEAQLKILTDPFTSTPITSLLEKVKIAKATGMSCRAVQVRFITGGTGCHTCNRRIHLMSKKHKYLEFSYAF